MGQPAVFRTEDTITGILEAVDGILQSELHGNCECEKELDDTTLTVEDVRNLLDAEARAEEMDAVREHLNNLRGNAESAIEAAYQKSRPWHKKKN